MPQVGGVYMSFVNELNNRYFEGRLSKEVLELLEPVNDERSEVQTFVARMFRQMQTERIDAKDFAEGLARLVGRSLDSARASPTAISARSKEGALLTLTR